MGEVAVVAGILTSLIGVVIMYLSARSVFTSYYITGTIDTTGVIVGVMFVFTGLALLVYGLSGKTKTQER